jgi:Glycosyltransferase family 87
LGAKVSPLHGYTAVDRLLYNPYMRRTCAGHAQGEIVPENKEAPINAIVAYLVAVLGVSTACFIVIGSLGNFGHVNDLPQYYAAGRMVLLGQGAHVYDTAALFALEKELFPTLERGVALFLPPPAVPLLVPVALIPLAVAPALWTIILAAALGLALWNIIRWQKLDRHASLWLIGLVAMSGPAVEALRLGQLSPLMLLALVCFARLSERRPLAAGAVLNVLIFKPQQLFPLLIFTGAGAGRKQFAAAAAGGLLLFAIAGIVLGNSGISEYLHLVSNPESLQLMQPELTPTVRGQFMRVWGTHAAGANLAAVAALFLSTVAVAVLGWRHRQRQGWMPICLAAAVPLGLVTSLHCHDYDLLLMIPGLVALVRSQLWNNVHTGVKLAIMLGLAAFLLPFYNDIHYGYLLKGGVVNLHFLLLLAFSIFMCRKALTIPDQFQPAAAGTEP